MKKEAPDLSRISLDFIRNISYAVAWNFGACKSEEFLENG
jgi:hypothetical protein